LQWDWQEDWLVVCGGRPAPRRDERFHVEFGAVDALADGLHAVAAAVGARLARTRQP
jgi:hypothetical protein